MRLSRRQFLLCASGAAAGALLAACAPRNAEPQPPEIAYGFDACESCGMLISEPRFACALLLEDGRYYKFDDLGDMVMYQLDRPNLKIAAWFVHDYYSEAWMRAETAFYVASDTIASPMGHGLAAFSAWEAADLFAKSECGDTECPVLNFAELRGHVHVDLHG